MNKIILTGNIVRDIEIRTPQEDFKVVNNAIAVKNTFKSPKGEYEAEFIEFSATGIRAELLAKYCVKGSKILIQGSLHSRKYNTQNGETRTVWYVQADDIELIDSKKQTQTNNSAQSNLKQALNKINTKQEESELKKYFGAEVNEEDLPF